MGFGRGEGTGPEGGGGGQLLSAYIRPEVSSQAALSIINHLDGILVLLRVTMGATEVKMLENNVILL